VQLAAKGCRVVVKYCRSEKEARETVKACETAGGEAMLARGDVANDADCRALAQVALDKWGRIDALINNAGITKYASASDLDALDAADFQRIYAVNLIGPYQMIRACAPAMKRQGAGSVVNISSSPESWGSVFDCIHRLQGGAQCHDIGPRRALAPAIRVNAVCPGMIETRWHRDRFDAQGYAKFKADYEKAVPLARPPPRMTSPKWRCGCWRAPPRSPENAYSDGGLHLGRF
jgi:3-oxoacyl-[acyl-carrier protein] reductase